MTAKEQYLIPVLHFEECIIERGKGSHVWDVEGNKYLDLNAGQFCSVLGHSNTEVLERLHEKNKMLQHTNTGVITSQILEAAEKINRLAIGMDAQSIFLTTGSEAIEFCLRYAKHIQKKPGVICFDKGYHGLTLAAQSVTYGGGYACPLVPNVFSVPVPNTFATEQEVVQCLQVFQEIVEKYKDEIAVTLMEPIVSVGGMHIIPPVYLKEVQRICHENDILLAFDECQTGFGRTGTWFYYEQIDCVPDILVTAKGIGLGYPVAVVSFRKQILDKCTLTMTHYSSHQNDPFVGNVVNVGVEYIEEQGVLEDVREKGTYLLEKITEVSEQYDEVVNPRGRGLMVGFELSIQGLSDYRARSKTFLNRLLGKGVMLQATNGGQTIRCLPNYLISYEEIDFFVAQLKYTLQEGL